MPDSPLLSGSRLRRLAVLAVVSAGLLTTMATSQPRWTVSDDLVASIAEGRPDVAVAFTGDGRTIAAADRVSFYIRTDDPLVIRAMEGTRWTVSTTLSREDKALTVDADNKQAYAHWQVDKKPCPPSGQCTVTFTFKREGDALPALQELTFKAEISQVGESSPPGGDAANLRLVEP